MLEGLEYRYKKSCGNSNICGDCCIHVESLNTMTASECVYELRPHE